MIRYIGADGKEETRQDFLDRCFQFTNPIWDSVVRDLDICTNCWCSDCGCCVGCGQVDADLFGAHGYVCVM